MMNVMYQLIDQMTLAVSAPQGPGAQSQAPGKEEQSFESLIHEKYQEAAGQEGAQKETETKAPEAGRGEMEGQEATQEQYEMAAAMMALCQPVVYEQAQVEPDETAEPTFQQAVEPLAAGAGTQAPPVQAFAPAPQQTSAPQGESDAPDQAAMPQVQDALPADNGPVAQPQPEQKQADVSTAFQGKQSKIPEDVKEQEHAAAPQEAPVFGQMEAAPVKVAEAPAEPVELQAEDGMEQLAERVTDALEQGISKVEVSLSPKSLGSLTVEITRGEDGSLSVVLNAAAPKAAAVLEQHSGNLQNLLMGNTQAPVRVEVHGSQEGQQQFLNPDDSGRQGQQQGQQQEHRQQKNTQDFIQQLRLGLIDLEQVAV